MSEPKVTPEQLRQPCSQCEVAGYWRFTGPHTLAVAPGPLACVQCKQRFAAADRIEELEREVGRPGMPPGAFVTLDVRELSAQLASAHAKIEALEEQIQDLQDDNKFLAKTSDT
jgi:hypothetical protein